MTPIRTAFVCAAGALLFSASPVFAGPDELPPPAPAAESPWEFRLEPYFWASGLFGTTGVAYEQVPTDLNFKNLATHLKMAFASQFEVRYSRFGFLADISYADIGGFVSVPDPRIRQFAVDTKLTIFQFLPNYRVYRSDKGFIDLLAGARGWNTKIRLTNFRDVSRGVGAPNFIYENRSATKAWVDFVGGVRGQYFLYQGLFVAAYGDIGGGSSTLTWQVQGTLGYKFSKLISAELGWRLLSDDYRSGGFTYNVKQQGLYTGVSFTF